MGIKQLSIDLNYKNIFGAAISIAVSFIILVLALSFTFSWVLELTKQNGIDYIGESKNAFGYLIGILAPLYFIYRLSTSIYLKDVFLISPIEDKITISQYNKIYKTSVVHTQIKLSRIKEIAMVHIIENNDGIDHFFYIYGITRENTIIQLLTFQDRVHAFNFFSKLKNGSGIECKDWTNIEYDDLYNFEKLYEIEKI